MIRFLRSRPTLAVQLLIPSALMFSVAALAESTGTMTINQVGHCPGESEVRILGAPAGNVAIGGARDAAPTTLPGGTCARTILGLRRPVLLGTIWANRTIRIDVP